jgi:hypothetical protein
MIVQEANHIPTDKDVATSSHGVTGRSWCRIRLQYRSPAEEKGVSHDRCRRDHKAKRRKMSRLASLMPARKRHVLC